MTWPGLPVAPTMDEMLMIRPQRDFIIGRTTPRHRRMVAVRLTSITEAQSSSDMRMKSWSRVMPALLTRMSMPPIAAMAAFGRASTARGSARLHGSTNARSPRSAARAFSGSSRVPDRPTVAPAPCRVRAMAAPMPPEAPVIEGAFVAEVEHGASFHRGFPQGPGKGRARPLGPAALTPGRYLPGKMIGRGVAGRVALV